MLRRDWTDAATSQGMLAAAGSWKRQANGFCSKPLQGARPCRYLGVSPARPLDRWPPEVGKHKPVWCEVTLFVVHWLRQQQEANAASSPGDGFLLVLFSGLPRWFHGQVSLHALKEVTFPAGRVPADRRGYHLPSQDRGSETSLGLRNLREGGPAPAWRVPTRAGGRTGEGASWLWLPKRRV